MALKIENGDSKIETKIKNPNSSRNKKKKQKKKNAKERKQQNNIESKNTINSSSNQSKDEVEIEYVTVNPLEQLDLNDPNYGDFAQVFNRFTPKEETEETIIESTPIIPIVEELKVDEDDEESKSKLSKKQQKKFKRLSIAVLKQIVKRPELVESWDVTSSDPSLLVHLKSYRNTVPVPKHWNQKRKYLQGKRGVEKHPFELPEFIAATGISKLRTTTQDKEGDKSLKQKQREKMTPKMGRMDIDYRVLHDAFFSLSNKTKTY